MATYAGRYNKPLQDRYGNGYRNALVAVQTLAAAPVTLYADRDKTAYVPAAGLAANEIKADSRGNLIFFADPGNYQIVVTPSGGSTLAAFPISVLPDPLEPDASEGALAAEQAARIAADDALSTSVAGKVSKSANGSDFADVAAVRDNLGLGDAATQDAMDLPVSTAQGVALELRESVADLNVTHWDLFDRPDGAIGTSDSGHPYTVSGSLGAVPVVLDNKMACSLDGTAFAQLDCGVAPVQIGVRFTFEPGTDGGGLMFGTSKESDLSITDQLHFLITPTTWNFQYRQAAGAFLSFGNGTFATALAKDSTTEYECVIEIVGTTARVKLPDGNAFEVTNALIATLHGRYAIWEPTRPGGGVTESRITGLWAVTPATVRPSSPWATKGFVAGLVGRITDTLRRLVANPGETYQVVIGRDPLTGFPAILFGPSGDASWYRAAANQIRTAGNVHVVAGAANQIIMGTISGGAGFLFGSASDTAVRRTAADTLQMGTGDHFKLDGTWNGGRLQLGNYHLWVDATGALRVKSGAPASDLDGTVVGAQT
jgi:hypothetical protein